MSKDKKKDKDEKLDLPGSMQEEVFIHQFLRKFGATEEEAIAFAKIYGNMISEIGDRLEKRISRMIGWGLGTISVLIAILAIFAGIQTFSG